MWRRAVLVQATALVLVTCTLDVRYYSQKRVYTAAPQVECFDYPEWGQGRYTRAVAEGWARPSLPGGILFDSTTYSPPPFLRNHLFSRRNSVFTPKTEDIVKEHAKLVQDINGLKQALFVAPVVTAAGGSKDYDDTIYLEAIETTTTTAPTTTRQSVTGSRRPGSSIPVVLVGGASQRTVIKSPPLKFTRPTVSLVGTSASPLVRHPYPFAVRPTPPPPLRICMPAMTQTSLYTKSKPNLLQRILDGIVSR